SKKETLSREGNVSGEESNVLPKEGNASPLEANVFVKEGNTLSRRIHHTKFRLPFIPNIL
ncbi:hypothetical protein J4G37_46745, partial [Microvirga sp. 3-52]|nr:hypothetical protein [Microvirga sp. 3-52]